MQRVLNYVGLLEIVYIDVPCFIERQRRCLLG